MAVLLFGFVLYFVFYFAVKDVSVLFYEGSWKHHDDNNSVKN